MKRFFSLILSLSLVSVFFGLPSFVMADDAPADQPPINVGNPLDPNYQTNANQPASASGESAISVIQKQLGVLLSIMLQGIAAISLLPIVVGGFQMIISQGDEQKVTRGKETLYFGVVGLVLALTAIAIFQTFLTFINFNSK